MDSLGDLLIHHNLVTGVIFNQSDQTETSHDHRLQGLTDL